MAGFCGTHKAITSIICYWNWFQGTRPSLVHGGENGAGLQGIGRSVRMAICVVIVTGYGKGKERHISMQELLRFYRGHEAHLRGTNKEVCTVIGKFIILP